MGPLFVIVFVFGVLGFASNLFYRAIWLYCEWREGTPIDWKRQLILTFLVPAGYTFALAEIVMVLGREVAP
jgi:hypothetical protein